MSPRGHHAIDVRPCPGHAGQIQKRECEPAEWQHPSQCAIGIKPHSDLSPRCPNMHFGKAAVAIQIRELFFDVGPLMHGVEKFYAVQYIQAPEDSDSSLA